MLLIHDDFLNFCNVGLFLFYVDDMTSSKVLHKRESMDLIYALHFHLSEGGMQQHLNEYLFV